MIKTLSLLLLSTLLAISAGASEASADLAQGKPVTASSVENDGMSPALAVDGSSRTRWSSAFTDHNWITVDLQARYDLSDVNIHWQNSYSKDYDIKVSDDGEHWTTVHSVVDSDGGWDEWSIAGQGRYLRIEGYRRATDWGHSIWQLEVYGAPVMELVSEGRPAFASSVENASMGPERAVDGQSNTRWSSDFTDHNWIYVDLEELHQITGVKLYWQNSYSKDYEVQTSHDGTEWTSIHSVQDSDGGLDDLQLEGQGRYLRIEGTRRATNWGHSLWQLEVYGYALANGDQDDDAGVAPPPAEEGSDAAPNLALHQPATSSSDENARHTALNAVDGDMASRWSSAHSENNWLTVDLGAAYNLNRLAVHWEAAFAADYDIHVSQDGNEWTRARSITGSDGGLDDIALDAVGRYVRLQGVKRATNWGISLWQLEVFGTPSTALVSAGRPASVSSVQNDNLSAHNLVDGDLSTRWASRYADRAWAIVDLESIHQIQGVELYWESAHSSEYDIETSDDGESWTVLRSVSASEGGHETWALDGAGRYLRINSHSRATSWGHSLWQLEVYGYALAGVEPPPADESEPLPVPTDFVAGEVDGQGATLSWGEQPNVFSYEVYRDGVRVAEVLSPATHFTDTDLAPGQSYDYTIRARDVEGHWSELSDVIRVSTTGDSPVEGSVTLEWRAPDHRENGNYLELDEIGGYEIRYRKEGESDFVSVVVENRYATEYELTGLNGAYEFSIAVYDSNGLYSRFVSLTPISQ